MIHSSCFGPCQQSNSNFRNQTQIFLGGMKQFGTFISLFKRLLKSTNYLSNHIHTLNHFLALSQEWPFFFYCCNNSVSYHYLNSREVDWHALFIRRFIVFPFRWLRSFYFFELLSHIFIFVYMNMCIGFVLYVLQILVKCLK